MAPRLAVVDGSVMFYLPCSWDFGSLLPKSGSAIDRVCQLRGFNPSTEIKTVPGFFCTLVEKPLNK